MNEIFELWSLADSIEQDLLRFIYDDSHAAAKRAHSGMRELEAAAQEIRRGILEASLNGPQDDSGSC